MGADVLPALVNIGWAAAVYQPRDQYNWLRYMRMDGQDSAANYLYERARFIIQLALEWLPNSLLLPFLATKRWRRSIPLLSLPLLVAALFGLRHGAPARPALSGAIAGALSAGLAATLYAAHCTDDSPLFVATWYTLATALVAAIGALAGSKLLKW
jgi:hypothetical protein